MEWGALFISSFVISILAAYVWRHRRVHGARPFALGLLCVAGWSITRSPALGTADHVIDLLRIIISVALSVCASVLWVIFVIQYTGNGKWLTHRNLGYFAIVTLVAIMPVLIDSIWQIGNGIAGGIATKPSASAGSVLEIHTVYNLALVVTSLYLLLGTLIYTPTYYRAQVMSLLTALALAVTWQIVEFGFAPLQLPNLTSYFLIGAAAIITLAIRKYRLLDLIPPSRIAQPGDVADAIIVTDSYHRVVDLNSRSAQLIDRSTAHVIGQPLASLFSEWPQLWSPSTARGSQVDGLPLMDSHSRRYFEPLICPLTGRQGNCIGYVIILRDVTRYYQPQDLSMNMSHEVVHDLLATQRANATLLERKRLARELHDGVGQVLGYIRMQAYTARQLLLRGRDADAEALLNRLIEVAEKTQTEVRDEILGLNAGYTTEMHNPGLEPSLRHYLEALASKSDMRIEFSTAPELTGKAIHLNTEVQVMRIIQEAVTNVRKHARAQQVRISLTLIDNMLHGVIEDDGIGFVPGLSTEASERHFGLHIMVERAQEVGGTLLISSSPGKGTSVVFDIPCDYTPSSDLSDKPVPANNTVRTEFIAEPKIAGA